MVLPFRRPTIRIYDHQFNLEKEILIIGPEVDIYEERFHKREEDPLIKSVRPHFTDFQVTENNIYLMCHGVLYQMDHGGQVLSRTGFYANEEMEKIAGYKFRFHLNHAVVTDSGRVYLGLQGSGFFEHDLYYADVPCLKSDGSVSLNAEARVP